jgi:hypothetical protein
VIDARELLTGRREKLQRFLCFETRAREFSSGPSLASKKANPTQI